MNNKLKNMLDICEYLVHEFNENGSQIQTPHEGQLALQCFRLHGQSTTLTWGKKETH